MVVGCNVLLLHGIGSHPAYFMASAARQLAPAGLSAEEYLLIGREDMAATALSIAPARAPLPGNSAALASALDTPDAANTPLSPLTPHLSHSTPTLWPGNPGTSVSSGLPRRSQATRTASARAWPCSAAGVPVAPPSLGAAQKTWNGRCSFLPCLCLFDFFFHSFFLAFLLP
jgi:hypothetical protein